MKKLLLKPAVFFLMLAGLASQKAVAQTIDTTTMEGLYQYIFYNLNKSRIPTNYLAEYGVPVVPMETFNGILTDSNKIDMNLWRTLYWQMQTAYTGTGTNAFGSIINTNASITSALSSTNIPIPLILGNYNSVSPNAFTNNQLTISNNQVWDGPNTSSPYVNNNLFAASPAVNYTKTGTASFVFNSNLFFNNSPNTVSGLWIDFGDNAGYRSSSWDIPVTANYADTGWHTLKIKLVLTDNSVRECYSRFYVQAVGGGTFAMNFHKGFESMQTHAGPFAGDLSTIFAPLDYTPFFFDATISIPPSPNYIGGTVVIQYSHNNTTGRLQKPLIVVEGYDISSVAPNIMRRSYNISDFVRAISGKAGQPTFPYDFNHHLDDIAGYDLVFVQFTNGTADIRNNAAFLTAVIQQVNNLKAAAGSTYQNVIMGLSMGGLVARYALADMTKRGITTGTRLLISHDSPHRGANIPIGLQYLIQMAGGVHFFGYDVRNVYPAYDEAINLLNRDATRQLLLYTATGPNTFAANSFLDGDYRNMITFQPTDPQPSYQFIATSLGSQCGQPLFQPYTNLINIGTNFFLFRFPVVSYKLRFDAQAYALPNTGVVSTIASLSYKSLFKLFGLITIAKQVYNNSANSPGNHLPVDGAPGSTNPLIDVSIPNISPTFIPIPGILGFFGYLSYSSTGSPQVFSFVSTASALDVSPFDNTVFSQKFVGGANSSYPSTASTYIAQEAFSNGSSGTSYNNEHILFTPRNAEWLFDQMQNISNNINCSTECTSNLIISGPDPLCTSAIYQIPNLNTGTVSWTSSPANIVSIAPVGNGYQATISKITSGNVTISATTNCNQSIFKAIHVGGYSSPDYPVSGPSSSCANQTVYYNTNTLPGATNYNWFWPSDWSYLSGQGSPYLSLLTGTSSGPVGVRVANSCDAGGSPGTKYTQIVYCGYAFTVSPNPANTTIKVANAILSPQKGATPANTTNSFTLIQIIDKNGNIKQQNKFVANTTQATIDISKLSPDVYIVRIYNGNTWEEQRIVVAR